MSPSSGMQLLSVTEDGDTAEVTHVQRVDPILLANKYTRLHTDEIWRNGKNMKQIASIPEIEFVRLQQKWKKIGGTGQMPRDFLKIEIRQHPEWHTTTKRF